MAHNHIMYDSDPHFKIDGDTRELIYSSPEKMTIIQHDHNSEIVTFDMPRMIDGHDMSACNSVQVHYINTDINSSTTSVTGIYEVTDMHVSDDDDNMLVLSWSISGGATSLVGPLAFALRFACTEGAKTEYVWHTKMSKDFAVSRGISNEDFALEYTDLLQAWYDKLFGTYGEFTKTIGDIDAALDSILAIQEALLPKVSIVTFTVFTGETVEYTAIEGMTWGEWCVSEYNTGGFYIDPDFVIENAVLDAEGSPICEYANGGPDHILVSSETIIPNGTYGWE